VIPRAFVAKGREQVPVVLKVRHRVDNNWLLILIAMGRHFQPRCFNGVALVRPSAKQKRDDDGECGGSSCLSGAMATSYFPHSFIAFLIRFL